MLAAFCAAENTEEKNPLEDCCGTANPPPGVFASSIVGVRGAAIELDSLLGGFVAERARLCDIILPEGETTTSGMDCAEACLPPFLTLEADAGEAGRTSVGVGGVTRVVGASTRFGGVAGICVKMRWGPGFGNDDVDCVSLLWWSCGGVAWRSLSSPTLVSRFFPPKSAPRAPLVLGRAGSVVSDGGLGEVDRRAGTNASFSLFAGEVPRLAEPISIVWARRGGGGSSEEKAESTSVASDCAAVSRVSELIRGEEWVR